MSSIDQLLAKRHAKRGRKTGNKNKARERAIHTRYIAEHYAEFDELRTHLLHPKDHPRVGHLSSRSEITYYLEHQGWITRTGERSWTLHPDHELRAYISGGWLEEYVFLAHEAAGCDEVYYAQEVDWEVNGVKGQNEIDVLARRGSLLSFTSCKTIHANKSDSHQGQLRAFITEADYWNIHFASDEGRALLVVTADFIDELHGNRHRYPQLMARATILNVSIASLEELKWNRLIKVIEKHWNQ